MDHSIFPPRGDTEKAPGQKWPERESWVLAAWDYCGAINFESGKEGQCLESLGLHLTLNLNQRKVATKLVYLSIYLPIYLYI